MSSLAPKLRPLKVYFIQARRALAEYLCNGRKVIRSMFGLIVVFMSGNHPVYMFLQIKYIKR